MRRSGRALRLLDAMCIIHIMITSSPPTVRDVLRAYFGAVILVEPLQLSLWNSARVTLTQLRILRRLHDGPQCASDLARAVAISAPSLTRLLDRLVEEGYVERSGRESDRRRVDIALSETGRSLIEGHDLIQGSPLEKAVESMDPAKRLALLEALTDFTDRVRGEASKDLGGKEAR